MNIFLSWLLNAIAVIVSAYLIPWVAVDTFWTALVVALVLAIVNTVLKPLLILLTLPINILTLGLFTFVINALLILLTDGLVDGFSVGGFWSALLFSVILGLVNGAFGGTKNDKRILG